MSTTALSELWRPLAVGDGETWRWRLGAATLWVRRLGAEWLVATRTEADPMAAHPPAIDREPPPDDLAWVRRIAPPAVAALRVVPRLPDRPVVSRPAHPLWLLPGAECRLFIGIPAFLALRAVPGDQELLELPAAALSKSWSGSVVDGEPCYALRTAARSRLEDLQPAPHRIVCPVHLRNQSAENLAFARIMLPVGGASVYLGRTRLWSCPVEATYLGGGQWGEIRPDSAPPPFDGARDLLAPARDPGSSRHLRPLLSELKHLAHL